MCPKNNGKFRVNVDFLFEFRTWHYVESWKNDWINKGKTSFLGGHYNFFSPIFTYVSFITCWSTVETSDSFDKRCVQIKEQEKKLHSETTVTSIKWTNKGDIDCWVQLLPSFPPSLMFDPVDVKAGDLTKEPVWKGRKHHVISISLFFF